MNEFELFFDKNKNKWFIELKSFPMKTSIRFLINPSENKIIFWNATMYQQMLQWLQVN